jgi:hypothetical protein
MKPGQIIQAQRTMPAFWGEDIQAGTYAIIKAVEISWALWHNGGAKEKFAMVDFLIPEADRTRPTRIETVFRAWVPLACISPVKGQKVDPASFEGIDRFEKYIQHPLLGSEDRTLISERVSIPT